MMRRVLLCIVFAMLLVPLRAQVPDEVVASSDDLQYGDDVNVSTAVRPEPKSLNGSSEYSHFFLEELVGIKHWGSMGMGASFAYLPKVLGGYASAVFYRNNTTLSGGLTVRPLAGLVRSDWQLFGGLAYSSGVQTPRSNPVGFEVGIRLGANSDANGGRFAWWSLSLSRLYVDRQVYYTLGLSLNLLALTGFLIVI